MNKWIIPKSVKKFVVGWIRTYKWIKLNKKNKILEIFWKIYFEPKNIWNSRYNWKD